MTDVFFKISYNTKRIIREGNMIPSTGSGPIQTPKPQINKLQSNRLTKESEQILKHLGNVLKLNQERANENGWFAWYAVLKNRFNELREEVIQKRLTQEELGEIRTPMGVLRLERAALLDHKDYLKEINQRIEAAAQETGIIKKIGLFFLKRYYQALDKTTDKEIKEVDKQVNQLIADNKAFYKKIMGEPDATLPPLSGTPDDIFDAWLEKYGDGETKDQPGQK